MRLNGLALTAAAALALGACGDDENESSDRAAALPQGSEPVEIEPADFSPDITNRYWPMRPGTRWVYRESEDGERLKVVVTATSETKKLANGVTARVVRDTVSNADGLIEDTFDWYAQDSDGNVWYMGEDTAEFEDGKVSSRGGAWEAGRDGALPGVLLPADPQHGMRYRQEYYAGEAEDNGEVLSLDEQTEVPAGHFEHALMTKDTNALEPKVNEYKLYAPNVGPVLALGVSGGFGQEVLLRRQTVSAAAAKAAGTTPLGEPYE